MMNKNYNMPSTDRHPLIYGGIIFLLLIGFATFIVYRTSNLLQEQFDETLSLQIKKQSLFEDQIRVLLNRYYLLRDIVTVEDPFDKDDLILRFQALAGDYIRLRIELDSMPLTQRERKLHQLQIEQTRSAYALQTDIIDRSIQETDPAHYQEILDNIQPIMDDIYSEIISYRTEIQKSTSNEIILARKSYEKGWFTILIFYLIAIVLGTITVVWLAWHQRKRQQELQWMATHDPLTELSNRASFDHAIEQQIDNMAQDSKSSVMYIDLDRFKYINDSCGSIAGDDLLIQLAKRLKHLVRASDLVARIGGDEFGVILLGCDTPESLRIADKILQSFNEFDFIWENKHFDIGVSIGITTLDHNIKDVKQVIKQADAACYTAKDLGRNRIHVYSETDEDSSRKITELERVNQIRHAIDNNGFCLYQQTIEPLNPSNKKHHEILLRLLGEGDSVVTPDQFLPEAERYDLITKIDYWVVQRVLHYLKTHNDEKDIYTINLSGKTLNDKKSPQNIINEINSSNIKPNILCFEITETAAIRDLSCACHFLDKLQDMGCLIALDDFGTGLSSFSYLKQLPVDYIKIDGSFIKDLKPGSQDYAFVKAIHSVSEAMGIQTIAEWVETPTVLGYLKDLHIDYAQGFHIARPVPLVDMH